MERSEVCAGARFQLGPKARFNRLRCMPMKVSIPRQELAPVTMARIENSNMDQCVTLAFSPAGIWHGLQPLRYWRKRLHSGNPLMPVDGRLPLIHSFVGSGIPSASPAPKISRNSLSCEAQTPYGPITATAPNHQN